MVSYKCEPIKVENGIFHFSKPDEYIKNYEEISADHLESLKLTGENPFMSSDYWNELEDDTIFHLKPFLSSGDKILDVGVGLGRVLSKLGDDYEKYGIDISEEYLLEAKQKGINVAMSKIEDMPYEDESFDVIITTDVMEHVIDYNLCMNQILRVLKKGGVLLMRVPYKENLDVYLTYERYKYVHLRSFDEPSTKLQFIKIFNCDILSVKKMGFIENPAKYKVEYFDIDLNIFRAYDFLMTFIANRFKGGDVKLFYTELVKRRIFKGHGFFKKIFTKLAFDYLSADSNSKLFNRFYDEMEISFIVRKK